MSTEKKQWPANPWPSDAKLVEGIHPGLSAHVYRNGKYTNYIVQVAYEAQYTVEKVKADLAAETGEPVRTRNIKFQMPDGTEQWWMSVPKNLLTKLDEASRPQAGDHVSPPKPQVLDGIPETADVAQKLQDTLKQLIACLDRDRKCLNEGRYISMGESKDELRVSVKRQKITVMSLQLQAQDVIDAVQQLRGVPEIV